MKRYVIMEHKRGDRFEDILEEGTSLEDAKMKARIAQENLVPADRASIELAYVEVDEDGIIDPDGNGYDPIPFGRGGARQGAGRKPSEVKKVTWSVKVTEEEKAQLIDALKKIRGLN